VYLSYKFWIIVARAGIHWPESNLNFTSESVKAFAHWSGLCLGEERWWQPASWAHTVFRGPERSPTLARTGRRESGLSVGLVACAWDWTSANILSVNGSRRFGMCSHCWSSLYTAWSYCHSQKWLREAAHRIPIQQYYKDKHKWSKATFDLIHWSAQQTQSYLLDTTSMTEGEYSNSSTGGFQPMIDYIGKNNLRPSDAHFVTIWLKTILIYFNVITTVNKTLSQEWTTESNKTILTNLSRA
jgi:hypothetical protein